LFQTRKSRRGAVIAALAAGLVLAAPAAAQAHVGVAPDTVSPDESAVLTFSFTHGCETSDTTSVRITMPEGLASVSPTVDAMWDIAVERGDDGLVSAVTYTAVAPVPHDLRGAVTMAVRPTQDAPESLVFPVEQQCETGVNEWVEVAEDGQDPHELDSPAPVVTVADGAGEPDAVHGGDDHGSTTATTQEPESDPAPVIGIVLGAAGLLAGVAALIVSLRVRRRS
jgi:uncharacterized protein YcnI